MFIHSGLILLALVTPNPKETREVPVPRICIEPADKRGRPDRDRAPLKVTPHCPNPEIVKTPTKIRRVPK